jgi:zinc protease
VTHLIFNSYKKFKPLFLPILFFLPILQIGPVFCANPNSIFTPYTKVTLENGLTVIIKEVHAAPTAAIDIRVATGAKNETPDESGISHFVEHMLFKGTRHRKVGAIAREIQSVGGNLNAETSLDTTHYYVTVPSEYIELALDVTADAIQHSIFEPSEIDREKNVIFEEISMRQDNPQIAMGDLMIQKIFAGTPYANNILGTPTTLKNINRETLLNYYHQHYVPNNMTLVVVGDVNTNQVLKRVKKLFKDFNPNQENSSALIEMPKLKEISRFEIQKDLQQRYLYFGFPAPALNSKDGIYLGLLRIILGGCRSSRLLALTGQQFVNSISADYTAFKDAGLFTIYVATQNTSLQVEDRVQLILKQIIENGVTDDELAKAKVILLTQLASGAESNNLLANMMSNYEVNGSIEDAVNYEKSIRATKENLRQAAKEYLDPDRYVLIVVNPKEVQ